MITLRFSAPERTGRWRRVAELGGEEAERRYGAVRGATLVKKPDTWISTMQMNLLEYPYR